jgi:hypothetical protein
MRCGRVQANGERATTSTSVIARTNPAKPDTLFGTCGMRASENATSSAVKPWPSCQVTPGRNLNSQTVGPNHPPRDRQIWDRLRVGVPVHQRVEDIGRDHVVRRIVVEMRIEGGDSRDRGQGLRVPTDRRVEDWGRPCVPPDRSSHGRRRAPPARRRAAPHDRDWCSRPWNT